MGGQEGTGEWIKAVSRARERVRQTERERERERLCVCGRGVEISIFVLHAVALFNNAPKSKRERPGDDGGNGPAAEMRAVRSVKMQNHGGGLKEIVEARNEYFHADHLPFQTV